MAELKLNLDDLVLATTFSSGKLHILRFKRWRENAKEDQKYQFSGYSLCQMFSKYYWEVRDKNSFERCPRCFSRWRALNSPTVVGWNHLEGAQTDHPRLAFAWKEVPPVGHPSDAGRKKKEDDPRDEDEAPRQELRRWVRGKRYVRLVEFYEDDYTHGVFVGIHDESDSLRIRGTLVDCLKKVSVIMAMGGET